MNHEQSIETRAAEGYLLGELPAAAREEFEQHYFECAECAEEVRTGFQFGQNVNAVFHEQAGRRRGGWLTRMRAIPLMPMAAGLAIVAFTSYQNTVEIPALRARAARLAAPQVLSPAVLAPSTRGDAASLVVPAGADFLSLSLASGAASGGGPFECVIKSGSGKVLWKIPVSTLVPDTNLTILVPTFGLSSGQYEAILSEHAGELDHYRFSLIREQ